jgi:hypothetical protein
LERNFVIRASSRGSKENRNPQRRIGQINKYHIYRQQTRRRSKMLAKCLWRARAQNGV